MVSKKEPEEPIDRDDYTNLTLPMYLMRKIHGLREPRKTRSKLQRKTEPSWFVVWRAINLYEQSLKESKK